ncbi:hypothetical protein AC249_AIPGENE15429 [Exaiptasia diaphana]|nr:hypothetical protein AC249_AIPGENE15429 [Exaiptasia diaphana]
MGIDVEAVESAFEWETFENGKPYLGTYKQEIPNRVRMMTMKLDLKDWIKIDKTYASQQHEKERLIKTNRNDVFVCDGPLPMDHSSLAKMVVYRLF